MIELQYKLYKAGNNDISNVVEEVLRNRGILDYNTYLNLDESVVIPYSKLDNIDRAVELFMKHYNAGNKIGILIDTDVDGYCSASMLYSYIKRINNDYPLDYILHTRTKAHGLQDTLCFPDDMSLLIVPDAGTNDCKECKELFDKGIDVLVLDHHGKEVENPYALIVNNQMSDNYDNKELCGAGIVYKFLQALDEELWCEFANDYLDLVAFANISDNMNLISYETKYLITQGLKSIKSNIMKSLIKAQEYSMNNIVNIHNIQWSCTPLINALIRVGTSEEKEILFRAFIDDYEEFDYHKRATKKEPAKDIKENIYDRAARFCKNAKPRQDRNREQALTQIVELAKTMPENDKIIMLDTTDILNDGLTGVVAIKVADFFNKPCILLNKFIKYENDQEKIVYGGSARNVDYNPIESFRNVLNSTSYLTAKGHPNACGVELDNIDNFEKAKVELNNILKDVVYDLTYYVDFILNSEDISVEFINEFSQLDDIVGTGISEPMVAVENVVVHTKNLKLMGKDFNTVAFEIDGIKYIQFKCTQGDGLYDIITGKTIGNITLNLIGQPTMSEYEGFKTPQITIKDVEIINVDTESIMDLFDDLDDDDEEDVW